MRKLVRLLIYTNYYHNSRVFTLFNTFLSSGVASLVTLPLFLFIEPDRDIFLGVMLVLSAVFILWNEYYSYKIKKSYDEEKLKLEFKFIRESNKSVYFVLTILAAFVPLLIFVLFGFLIAPE